MKTFKTFFIIISTSILTFSCSDTDDNKVSPTPFEIENPLALFYTKAGLTKTSNFINGRDFEFGLAFTPNVKGQIEAVTLKLPAVNSTVRVTIWDYTTKTVLRTVNVNVYSADKQITQSIPVLALEKNKKYLITMNSNDRYLRVKEDNSEIAYPVIVGNITIHEYRWTLGSLQNFPENSEKDYNSGDLSFDFLQTE